MMATASDYYRRPVRKRIAQGDIALTDFHQLRSRSGSEPGGPGPEATEAPNLPWLGEFSDYEISVPRHDGKEELRILRVWSGYVMVLHQACELQFSSPDDSRLVIAPIVSQGQWPEGPWESLRRNNIPGYFYLPPVTGETARELELPGDWPEAVVCLANITLSSVGLIKARRELSIAQVLLPDLHDAINRFFTVRGFANFGAASATIGKRLVKVVDSNQTVHGPVRLLKLYFGDESEADGDGDDELTLANWGVRPG